jgi:glycosyltransferase involved in cell wall biosynthesis
MRILLIANYIPDLQQSMQRYAALLRDGFSKAGHEVRVIRPAVSAGKVARGGSAVKWLGYIDKLVLFPRELERHVEWAEMVHICDHSNAVWVKHIEGRPHVVTCHDLLAVRSALGEFPERETRWSGRTLQHMILDGLALARNIVCVSDATRADLMRLVPGGDREVTRIYNGLNYPFEPMGRGEAALRLEKFGLIPDQGFILHVGGNQWYKNRAGVVRIFAHVRKRFPNLLLAMAGKPWTAEIRQLVRSCGMERCVVELADVSGEDLRALYSRAETLLFPSLEEGFGWPVAEAQACGCPVVTSNKAPMTEVGGADAVYIDPLDYRSAAEGVASVILSGRGASREGHSGVARFSSAAMIEGYLGLYERLLGEGAAAGAGRASLQCA